MKTKKAKADFLKGILAMPPHEVTGLTREAVFQILQGHPDWDLKTAGQDCRLFVNYALYASKCFWLHREDGTKTDISYKVALTGHPSKRSEVIAACRAAIRPIITKFQSTVRYGEQRCPFTDDVLLPNNTHIDHYNMKFGELVNFWIDEIGVDYLYDRIRKNTDGETDIYFSDKSVIDEFQRFHNANTNLRAVSAFANLKILR
jgi:hypothetical protein